MRFYKEVWGIIWEFNSISEFISFMVGRLLGIIIFFGGIYLLIKCNGNGDFDESKLKFINPTTPVYEVTDLRYEDPLEE